MKDCTECARHVAHGHDLCSHIPRDGASLIDTVNNVVNRVSSVFLVQAIKMITQIATLYTIIFTIGLSCLFWIVICWVWPNVAELLILLMFEIPKITRKMLISALKGDWEVFYF